MVVDTGTVAVVVLETVAGCYARVSGCHRLQLLDLIGCYDNSQPGYGRYGSLDIC